MLDSANAEVERLQAQETAVKSKQEGVMAEASALSSPFQESYASAMAKKHKIEENMMENQALAEEMNGLLMEGIAISRKLQTQKVPGLAGIQQSTRMINAQNNINGRLGVIQAVMAARDQRIGVAENFINQRLGEMQADRNNRLNYLDNLFHFYETSRNELGQKIFNLTKEQKDIINRQRALIEYDLQKSEQAAEQIKKIMLENPLMAAQAGLSLNDTQEQINKKLADWQYKEEVRGLKNTLMANGMSALTPQEAKMYDADRIYTYLDSKGVEQNFLIPKTADYDFRTSGGNLYRVNKTDGTVELVASGGQTPESLVFTDPDTGKELSPREYAFQLANKYQDFTEGQLLFLLSTNVVDLDGKPIIGATEAKSIVKAARQTPKPPIDLEIEDASAIAYLYAAQNFETQWLGTRGGQELTDALTKTLNEVNSWTVGESVVLPGGESFNVTEELKEAIIAEINKIPRTRQIGEMLHQKNKELNK